MLLWTARLALLAVLIVVPARAQTGTPLYGLTPCCPNTFVEFAPETGEVTPIFELEVDLGAFTYPGYFGGSVFDPTTRRLYHIRNRTLIAVDLNAKTVTEVVPIDYRAQLVGYDVERELIYVFASSDREPLALGSDTTALSYRLMAVDPTDGTVEEIAVLGDALLVGEVLEGDAFSMVLAPVLVGADPLRLFAESTPNVELVTVEIPSGATTVGAPFIPHTMLAYAPDTGGLVSLEIDYSPSQSFTYSIRERNPETGAPLSDVVVGRGLWDGGNVVESDMFAHARRQAVYDAASDRVFFNRNGFLLTVNLTDGTVTEGSALGDLRLMSFPNLPSLDVGTPPSEAPLGVEAYPNPFRASATLRITLDRPQHIEVAAYDLLGRRIAMLHRGMLPAGTSSLNGLGRELSAGTYIVRIEGEAVRQNLRLTRMN